MFNSQSLGWPPWAVVGALIATYALLMLLNPARSSLRNGARCVSRYRQIWGILAILGVAYAGWQTGLRLALHYILPTDARPDFQWYRAWSLSEEDCTAILESSLLNALEGVAGIFNTLTTFPVSSFAALLLLLNCGGHFGILRRALRKRFGKPGWIIFGFVTLSAFAAVVKPLLYVFLPVSSRFLNGLDAVRIAFAIDWLAFTFEYLFGVLIQIYLILLSYVWIRGLNFTRQHLVDVAIRRFTYVIKWACVVLLFSTSAIDLPRVLSIISPLSDEYLTYPGVLNYITTIARPGLAVLLILFASVQIALTLHSEHLRSALRDNGRFLLRSIWRFGPFLTIAFVHFFVLHIGNAAVVRGFGEGTVITITWSYLYPVAGAWIAGWFLASWVCLFKAYETGHTRFQEMVRF